MSTLGMNTRAAKTSKRFNVVMDRSRIIATLDRNSALPHAVALLAQRDGELDFHVARAIVRHRVVRGVELGHQAKAIERDVAVRLDAGLVLVEAQVRVDAGHAD